MAGAWQSRMQWELKQLSNSPPPGVVVWPADGASLSHLEAQVEGPHDTVYEGGVFRLDIQIPDRYPHEPPKVRFVTQVYHPNVTPQTGLICLSTLNLRPKGDWTPATNLSTLMTTIRVLLSAPNPDDGLVTEITDQFNQNRAAFDATAREWTARYAKPGAVDPREGAASAGTASVLAAAPSQPAKDSPARLGGEGAPTTQAEAPAAEGPSTDAPATGGSSPAACGCAGEGSGSGAGAGAGDPPPVAETRGGAGADAENVPPPVVAGAEAAAAGPVKRPLVMTATEGDGDAQQPAAGGRKRRMQLSRPQPAASAPVDPAE